MSNNDGDNLAQSGDSRNETAIRALGSTADQREIAIFFEVLPPFITTTHFL